MTAFHRAFLVFIRPAAWARGASIVAAWLLLALLGGTTPAHGASVASDLALQRRLIVANRPAAVESLSAAVIARLEAERAPDSLALAEALCGFAWSRDQLTKYADDRGLQAAERSLGIRLRHLGPDALEVADAHEACAGMLLGMGHADQAAPHIHRTLDIRLRRLAPGDTLIASAWVGVAYTEGELGNLRGQLEGYQHALDIRTRAYGPEHPIVAGMLRLVGTAYWAMGDKDRARDTWERALAILDRTAGPDDPRRGGTLSDLAVCYRDDGEMGRALEATREARRIAVASFEDSADVIATTHNFAVLLMEFGDNAGARTVLREELPLCERTYGPTYSLTHAVRQALAIASAGAGDTTEALALFRQCEADCRVEDGPPDANLSTALCWEADLLHRGKHDRQALAVLDPAIARERRAPRPSGAMLTRMTELRIAILEPIGGAPALDSTARDLARIRDEFHLGAGPAPVVGYWLARASRAAGRPDDAWRLALDAERRASDLVRLNLDMLPDARGLEIARQKSYPLDLVLDMADRADTSRWAAAWDRLVRSRGRVRAERARRRLPAAAIAGDSAIAAAHARWVDASRRLATRLVRSARSVPDSATQSALAALRDQAEVAEGAYARLLAAHALAPPDTAEPGLSEIRSRLGAGEALVSFAEWRDRNDVPRMLAFVARGAMPGIERVDLGSSASLEAAIEPWRERLATPPDADRAAAARAERECRRLGLEVSRRVWEPIAARLAGARDVHLVADGPVLDLPWQALPAGAGAYRVEAGPTIHTLDAERDLAAPLPAIRGGSLLALGDADFDRSEAPAERLDRRSVVAQRSAADLCAGQPLALGALPGSRVEAEAVARLWRTQPQQQAELLVGSEASESAFKRDAAGHVVLHLATHGVVVGDTCTAGAPSMRGIGGVEPLAPDGAHRARARPDASAALSGASSSPWMGRRVWLALAGANHPERATGDGDDGWLTAEEVASMDLTGTDWVVLSACHSGLAERWSREGALGMRRAFELAGARSVIASQWAVGDDAAGEWMQALYRERAGGASTAAALRGASRTVLDARRRAGRSTHPFYWASFTASGE